MYFVPASRFHLLLNSHNNNNNNNSSNLRKHITVTLIHSNKPHANALKYSIIH